MCFRKVAVQLQGHTVARPGRTQSQNNFRVAV